jgi:hypothetical protein
MKRGTASGAYPAGVAREAYAGVGRETYQSQAEAASES